MTNTLKQTNNTKNGLIGSTVTFTGSGTAPIPPLTVGQAYTTNTNAGKFLTSSSNGTAVFGTHPNDNVMIVKQDPASLEVKGKMVINGVDLEERLDTIEKVLRIPERDVILEKKHPKLKKLYDEYINELSKYKMWQSIKGEK